MTRIAALFERWALAVWVGSLAGFAFVFAPVAFANLRNDLDVFAAIVGSTLGALTVLGYVCGGIAILTSCMAIVATRSRIAIARAACVVAMLVLVTYSQHAIVPAMVSTQASFHGSFASVPKSDPRRVRYDALHSESSRVYGAVLLLGLLAIALSRSP